MQVVPRLNAVDGSDMQVVRRVNVDDGIDTQVVPRPNVKGGAPDYVSADLAVRSSGAGHPAFIQSRP